MWNDPVNTMSYVVYVLRKLFGYDEPKATMLMLPGAPRRAGHGFRWPWEKAESIATDSTATGCGQRWSSDAPVQVGPRWDRGGSHRG